MIQETTEAFIPVDLLHHVDVDLHGGGWGGGGSSLLGKLNNGASERKNEWTEGPTGGSSQAKQKQHVYVRTVSRCRTKDMKDTSKP